MKRLFIIIILSFMLYGCAGAPEEESVPTFTLGSEARQQYEGKINEVLNQFYWYMDEESLEYYSGSVPQNNEENVPIFAASELNGYDLAPYSGSDAVIYQLDLVHFNGNKAGKALFYFIRGELAGFYYLSDFGGERAFDFGTRNVFGKDALFTYYEREESYNDHVRTYSYVIPDSFMDEYTDNAGRKLYLAMEEEVLGLYRFSGTSFTKLRTFSNFGTDMVPISAAFTADGGFGVILGTEVEINEYEHRTQLVSEKVVFFDSGYTLTDFEFELSKSSYSCIKGTEDGIILVNERDWEEYEQREDELVLKQTYNTRISATDIKITDLDGNGVLEYLMTDGNDFYVFQRINGALQCVWRTNISAEFYNGAIYTGDLNGDGVEEIYISDTTGTTIRYTLSENGLVVWNEDINYGEMYLVSDFDNNGIDDYILIDGIETPVKTLYLGR